jgi:hypothetical protein
MAGDVWLSKQAHWATNSSLYHWVLDFLISRVDDPGAVADLEEIRDANLGLVNLEDFDPKVQRRMLELLRHDLVFDAQSRLRADMPDRQGFIEGLQELAGMAQETTTG